MSFSLIVKCYLCGLDVNQFDCMGFLGLGPKKYVCPVCVGSAGGSQLSVLGVVIQKHDEKNGANRRYVEKRRDREAG
jgi:hypothetical protein